eukprot:TRINITY_DN55294_c0_g1_i1.p1 TRINITY_DN55294_c0_g1~~TRINITY_DN55294_c0_g1_i1.p1  ORF type:complete len:475 (-),score=48.42 TRINITY_DN55294_c0_g1_i1:514-1914(-)
MGKGHKPEGGRQYKLPNQGEVMKLWENFRRKDAEEATRTIAKVLRLVESYFIKAIGKPSLSRVLQSCLKNGNAEQRKKMLALIEPELVECSKDKAASRFVMKLHHYGGRAAREKIVASLLPYTSVFIKHLTALHVMDLAFIGSTKDVQRKFLLQLFNKVPSMAFKIEENDSADPEKLWEEDPKMKREALDKIWDTLDTCCARGFFDYQIIHRALELFLRNAPYNKCKILMQLCIPGFIHMCGTQPGSLVATKALLYLTQEERVKVLETTKRSGAAMCQGQYAHLLVCRLMDLIDDVSSVNAILVKEMQQDLPSIIMCPHGSKVLLHLLVPDGPKKRKFFQHQADLYSLWNMTDWRGGPAEVEMYTYDEKHEKIVETINECDVPPSEKHDAILGRMLTPLIQELCGESCQEYFQTFQSRRLITALLAFVDDTPKGYNKSAKVLKTLQTQVGELKQLMKVTQVFIFSE